MSRVIVLFACCLSFGSAAFAGAPYDVPIDIAASAVTDYAPLPVSLLDGDEVIDLTPAPAVTPPAARPTVARIGPSVEHAAAVACEVRSRR